MAFGWLLSAPLSSTKPVGLTSTVDPMLSVNLMKVDVVPRDRKDEEPTTEPVNDTELPASDELNVTPGGEVTVTPEQYRNPGLVPGFFPSFQVFESQELYTAIPRSKSARF